MNRGTTRYPKYFCDKCGVKIRYTYKRGFIGLYTYAKKEKNSVFKKSFDLCKSCENELQNWIKTREISMEIRNMFPKFEEE